MLGFLCAAMAVISLFTGTWNQLVKLFSLSKYLRIPDLFPKPTGVGEADQAVNGFLHCISTQSTQKNNNLYAAEAFNTCLGYYYACMYHFNYPEWLLMENGLFAKIL